jgi:hypothetical protein
MSDNGMDMNTALMVDGNAIAGKLSAIFAHDMTQAEARCAGCGNDAPIGALMAFTHNPGIVLRCPACQSAIARIVETPSWVYFEARGASFVRMSAGSVES